MKSVILPATAVIVAAAFVSPAHAATPGLTSVGRLAAPLASHSETGATMAEQEDQRPGPPPIRDPISGPMISVLGGSVFSGASAFQTGGALAYFWGAKASFGVEVEGNVTFGPGGRVGQAMGSFVWQVGARTSRFVPYFAGGVGYVRAKSKYPQATQAVLDELGIDPQPKTEQGPFFHYGGGLRFYVKPGIAFRGDVRFAYVPLDLQVDTGFRDRLFGMRRIAGMVSWDF
jgi:hypothetical protein